MLFTTDYPIEGNEAHSWIQVQLLAYDRNRYVAVQHGAVIEWIKAGYVRKAKASSAPVKYLSRKDLYSLPREVGGPKPSCFAVHLELKAYRKRETDYSLLQHDPVSQSLVSCPKSFSTRKALLDHLCGSLLAMKKGSPVYFVASRARRVGRKSEISELFEIDSGALIEMAGRGARGIGPLSRRDYVKLRLAVKAQAA
ncbi:hypothetical protein [Comamonas thiooxydans]|uniref:hypothetical protein n=1 Tax=Comamonas thiooxydans TaxID=363952 RepID=UPI000B40A3E0|nr:hypothetical protein [Comamonas thiooxydans]